MARKRRTYTQEFKQSAVQLVTEQGRSVAEAARSLGISVNVELEEEVDLPEDDRDLIRLRPGKRQPHGGKLPTATDKSMRASTADRFPESWTGIFWSSQSNPSAIPNE